MRWATRAGVHIDRAACAWLIRRHIDPAAEFAFLDDWSDPGALPADLVLFDVPGAGFGHRGEDCTFETLLRVHELHDPVLWRIAEIVHVADLDDDAFDAPEAPGMDAVVRGLSMTGTDEQTLAVTDAVFDGLHAYHRQRLLRGHEPA
jgi:hypothetical protein